MVEVDGEGTCSGFAETTTLVEVLPVPEISFQSNLRTCQDFVLLDAMNLGNEFTWQDGSSSQTYLVTESGTYSVGIDNGFCSTSGSIDIELIAGLSNLESLVPNVFTPNSDNMNDLFRINSNSAVQGSMQVYNRWGTLVHEDSGSFTSWDGKINGKDAGAGVYFYIIQVNPGCSEVPDTELDGTVTLFR